MKKNTIIDIVCIVIVLFLCASKTSIIYANLDDSIFVVKSTYPINGQTNVPIDLKSGLAGSSYSDPPGIGNIAVGYGTDLSGGCGNPGHCPEIPDINMGSINSSTVIISSPNDSTVTLRAGGNGTCYGQCYNSDDFYYNFSIIPNARLKPNTTYSVTIKGGKDGISAHRTVSSGEIDVYLPSDYSWSFTTGDINSASPPITNPTSIPRRTITPTSRPQRTSPPTPTLIPTIANKSTITPTITKKQSILTITPTIQITITETPTPTINLTQEITTTVNTSWWNKFKMFWIKTINKFRKQETPSKIVDNTPTIQPPTPTQIEEIPTITPTPTLTIKPKPTAILKPVSSVDENVLKIKFGITNQDLIKTILNDLGQLEKYEREYYQMLKGWVEIKTTAVEQRIYIPSLNTVKICKSANIIEIKNASINLDNIRTNESVLRNQLTNTKIVKSIYAISPEELQKDMDEINKKYKDAKDALNELIKKYCRDN